MLKVINHNKRIVVLQAGWVFIGNYHAATDTKPAYITDAYNIRKWGTTTGLGEIALNGPTKDTVLDPCGIVLLDTPANVLFTIPCEQ
jgi:hypothetical protein